jgi:hypothetical protein
MSLIAHPRSIELARGLQELSRERLSQTLDAIAGCKPNAEPSATAFDELLIVPFDRIDPRLVRDAHVQLRDGRRPPRPIRLLLLRRAAEIRELLNRGGTHPARLASLCLVCAGIMIPLLINERKYRRALRLAMATKRAVLRGEFESDDERPIFLLTPILWSLAAHLPAGAAGPERHSAA